MIVNRSDPQMAAVLEQIAVRLDRERAEAAIPGLSVAVVHDQDVIWSEGFGHANLETSAPATPQTIYRTGSTTKLFTATMLMQLRDAGKVCLDEPVEKYLPAFRLKSRFSEPPLPTFRQLATHMAGFPREAPLDYWQTLDFPSIEALLGSLNETEMVFPAWTEYKYSNLGYAVLGYALAAVAGEPYEHYVSQRILRPLGMASSGFMLTDDVKPQAAVGYITANAQQPKPAPHPHLVALSPAGQLYSSVSDLARFISLQFYDGADDQASETSGSSARTGAQILKGSTLREMHAPAFLSPDWQSAHGIAWVLERMAGETVLRHNGALFGYFVDVAIVPRLKVGVALGANAEVGSGAGLIQSVLEMLIPAVARQLSFDKQPRVEGDWVKYTGPYTLPGIMDVDILLIDGNLVLLAPAGSPQSSAIALVPEGPATFRASGGLIAGEQVVFQADATGTVTYVKAGSYKLERRQA